MPSQVWQMGRASQQIEQFTPAPIVAQHALEMLSASGLFVTLSRQPMQATSARHFLEQQIPLRTHTEQLEWLKNNWPLPQQRGKQQLVGHDGQLQEVPDIDETDSPLADGEPKDLGEELAHRLTEEIFQMFRVGDHVKTMRPTIEKLFQGLDPTLAADTLAYLLPASLAQSSYSPGVSAFSSCQLRPPLAWLYVLYRAGTAGVVIQIKFNYCTSWAAFGTEQGRDQFYGFNSGSLLIILLQSIVDPAQEGAIMIYVHNRLNAHAIKVEEDRAKVRGITGLALRAWPDHFTGAQGLAKIDVRKLTTHQCIITDVRASPVRLPLAEWALPLQLPAARIPTVLGYNTADCSVEPVAHPKAGKYRDALVDILSWLQVVAPIYNAGHCTYATMQDVDASPARQAFHRLGETFYRKFWDHLNQEDSGLGAARTGLLVSLSAGATSFFVQGLYGYGKTEIMMISMILASIVAGHRTLWLAAANEPLAAAAGFAQDVLIDAPPSLRDLIVRFPAQRIGTSTQLDVAYENRGRELRARPGIMILLISSRSLHIDLLQQYGALKHYLEQYSTDLAVLDEGQMEGQPSEVAVFATLHPTVLIIRLGDPRQPCGSPGQDHKRKDLLRFLLTYKHCGLRTPTLAALPPKQFVQAVYQSLEGPALDASQMTLQPVSAQLFRLRRDLTGGCSWPCCETVKQREGVCLPSQGAVQRPTALLLPTSFRVPTWVYLTLTPSRYPQLRKTGPGSSDITYGILLQESPHSHRRQVSSYRLRICGQDRCIPLEGFRFVHWPRWRRRFHDYGHVPAQVLSAIASVALGPC